MSAVANFMLCSCAILALAIINLSTGTCVGKYNEAWPLNHCGRLSDILEYKISDKNKEQIEKEERAVTECLNKKAMYNMEHVTFLFNAVIGFISTLLGLHGFQNGIEPKTGKIAMIFGIIGFILNFIYVILNGVVYTNYYDEIIYKVDGDSAFAELKGDNTYNCIYFNKVNDSEALYAKYNDLIKSQYNYDKELQDYFDSSNRREYPEKYYCNVNRKGLEPFICRDEEIITFSLNYTDKKQNEQRCEKLYYFTSNFYNYSNYDKSARFLSSLILSLFTVLCHCGLAFSGFMLSKESSKI